MDGRLRFSEYRHWSIALDCEAVRLSAFDARDQEYWMLLPVIGAKGYRKARAEALEYLAEAMHLGLDPGEVIIQ